MTQLSEIEITSRKEKQFNKKNIYCIEELIEFLPIGYRDYSCIEKIKDIRENEWVSVYGIVIDKFETSKVFSVKIKDFDNNTMRINWFGNSYYYDNIEINEKYVFCGKISSFGYDKKELCMNVPEAFSRSSDVCRITPRYSIIKGMSKEYLTSKINLAFEYIEKNPTNLEDEREKIAKKFNLQDRISALKSMHNPKDRISYKLARRRLNYDILYNFYRDLIKLEDTSEIKNPVKIKTLKIMNSFINSLPFELTEGQKNAIEKLKNTMLKSDRINGLLMGDVGSGKTIVAVSLAVGFCENNYQVAMLSPTQVLAIQNYEVVKQYLEPLGYKTALITSNLKGKEKKILLQEVINGNIDVLVGTHAILSDNVDFCNLGLTIVDEEHRFGVLQKNNMAKKISEGINNLSMSATPIPRSLALSIYSNNVEVLIVDTKPKNRLPIITKQVGEMDEAYTLMRTEIKKGRQCYVICPLIEDSESEILSDVNSVNSAYEELTEYFKNDTYIKIDKISGNMKGSDIDEALSSFVDNKTNILISTTIVEVGVNVPNASVIVVKNADRFGLAQLHQLRGRVGRGNCQSYCYLVSEKDKERLTILCKTLDGFKIAEEDLRLRGAGKLTGLIQTGYSEEIMTVVKYPKFAAAVKNEIEQLAIENSKVIA